MVLASKHEVRRTFRHADQVDHFTAVIAALRANMLQGAGLSAVAPQMAVLATWLIVAFTLALWLFRWK